MRWDPNTESAHHRHLRGSVFAHLGWAMLAFNASVCILPRVFDLKPGHTMTKLSGQHTRSWPQAWINPLPAATGCLRQVGKQTRVTKDTDQNHLRVRKGEFLPHVPFLRGVPIHTLVMHTILAVDAAIQKVGFHMCNGWKEPERQPVLFNCFPSNHYQKKLSLCCNPSVGKLRSCLL